MTAVAVASRSRGHRLLQLDPAARTGVPVEVRWDSSPLSERSPRRWAWHVLWPDGPTVTAMRAHAERASAALAGVDVERLVFARTVQPAAYALAMIRNLRLGQPPLGQHRSVWALEDWLTRENYPERGSGEDVELATRLVRLSRAAAAG